MKSIIVLLVAAMALVGFASAWTSTNCLEYQYTKTVETQAGEHLNWFADGTDTTSGADFNSKGAYGREYAEINNELDEVDANLKDVAGCYATTPTTKDTLTQGGYAIVFTEAPDLQKPCDLKKFAIANAWQELDLSGNYADKYCNGRLYDEAAEATFKSDVEVGIDSIKVEANSCVDTSVVTGENDRIIDAIMGGSITAGFSEINAVGANPTMFGSVDGWSGFEGAYGPYGSIDTYVDGHGSFDLNC
jgi:hypothetical protein